jgi:hypothetical protein
MGHKEAWTMATSTAGTKPATRQRRRDERGRFVKEDGARTRQPSRRVRAKAAPSPRAASSPKAPTATASTRGRPSKPGNSGPRVPGRLVALAAVVPTIAVGALVLVPRLLKHR